MRINLFFIFVLCLLFVLEIIYGSVKIPFEAFSQLMAGSEINAAWSTIIWESRMTRALTAIIGGGGLALSGLLMQTLFRNPLAGPSVLGISSGASLGVAILILTGGATWALVPSFLLTAGAAMAGAFLVLLVVLAVAQRLADNNTLLLFGVMLSYFTSAIVGALQFKASGDSVRSFVMWGMGTFTDAGYPEITTMLLALIVASLLTALIMPRLNLLLLGEDYATSLGVNVKVTRTVMIIATGILAGIITAFCGPIAFIGLAVPHLARTLMRTSDHSRLLLPVLLSGAIAGIGCDLLARLFALPMNTIASALGAPVVLLIILRSSKSRSII